VERKLPLDKARPIVSPAGLTGVTVGLARFRIGSVNLNVGRRGRARHGLRIAVAGGIGEAKIMFSVLVEVFRGNAVAAYRRFSCERDIALEYLMRAAADPNVGAAAFERLAALLRPL